MIYWLWALPWVAVVVHVLGRVHWQCSRTDLLRWLARSGVGVWRSCGRRAVTLARRVCRVVCCRTFPDRHSAAATAILVCGDCVCSVVVYRVVVVVASCALTVCGVAMGVIVAAFSWVILHGYEDVSPVRMYLCAGSV